MTSDKPSLSYRDAGVDIEAGDALVDRIKQVVRKTMRPEVVGGLGGFSALCRIPAGYRAPLLVSGTDGVGTKLRLAMQLNRHEHIGIDLVAMCVNDLLVCGAEPLFFLDYYATGHLDLETAATVIAGIGNGCEQAGCALVGGETAEMPGMYHGDDYDLAGFCVGVVEEDEVLDGHLVRAGDALVALPSSGVHSNGYSLVRKILEVAGTDPNYRLAGGSLADILMEPTRIYVRLVHELMEHFPVHAMAHITGGGIPGNLPRVLPSGTCARIDTQSWVWPEVFRWLQHHGGVNTDEMYRTFNCGVGMILVMAEEDARDAINWLHARSEPAWMLGQIMLSKDTEPHVVMA